MNFFKSIRENYGQESVKQVRDLEKFGRKIARHRNHLVFTLRCKELSITPRSLKLKCPIKTNRAREIVDKAQQQLLRERIRVINNKISGYKQQKSHLESELNSRFTGDLACQLTDHVTRKSESEFRKTKWRHQQKLERLQDNTAQKIRRNTADNVELGGEQLKKWAVNLSKYKTSKPQESLLAKGLNFSPSPTKIPYDEYIIATEKACRKLNNNEATVLRSEMAGLLRNVKPPKSNITKDERKAIQELKKEESILILPADKGKATVIIDASEYEDKINEMLSDERTYEKLPTDPTQRYKRELVAILSRLKNEEKINKSQYDLLYPTAENVPRIYGTPKIHKPGNKVRPIVDYTGTIGYQTSRALADILSPLVGGTEHHVLNSKHLAEGLAEVMIEEGEIFNSHDVVSLFTNTPIDQSLDVIRTRLKNDKDLNKRTLLSVDDIIELLRFVLTTTYFLFRGNIYKQRFGAAMGSPVSPVVANLYMEFLEQQAIATAPILCKPRLWKRYVDDILEIVNEDQVDNLTAHLNQTDPTDSIKFTYEKESNNSIPFLDTLIVRKPDGSVKLLVYRKATHTDQYLNFGSHHPIHHKLGVVRTLLDRMNNVVTEESDKQLEEEKIKSALSRCGYPNWAFKQVKDKMDNKQVKITTKKKDNAKKSRGYVAIPYVEGLSEPATRIFRKHDIATVMSPHTTLRKLLVHPKDKRDPLSTTGCVYEVPCINCNKSYIGETARRLDTRLKEHKKETEKLELSKRNFTRTTRKQSESEQSKSAIADHAVQRNHVINWQDAKVLDKECDRDVRHIKEAIWIRRRAPSTMNRDEGAHFLSHVFDPLLTTDTPTSGDHRRSRRLDLPPSF